MVSGSMAVLKVKNGQVGFQKSTLKQIAAGSAYIPYQEGQEEFRALQDVETSLVKEELRAKTEKSVGEMYDLSGRKIDSKKGVVICNNKKMLKK